jgi:hypothetical protein
MKYEFMFFCLVVPGLDHPGQKFNVMLKPLIDELKELWNGIEAYDYHKKQKFTLRVAYLWSIHDFMPYSIFAGWSVHGRLTCLRCCSDTNCFRLTTGGKINYFDCHQCWLPLKHPFRLSKDSFRKDTTIRKGPPKLLSGPETAENLSKLVLNREGNGYKGYGEEHNWTPLWKFPYAQALILMHTIDVMHQERNVVESIVHVHGYYRKNKRQFKGSKRYSTYLYHLSSKRVEANPMLHFV